MDEEESLRYQYYLADQLEGIEKIVNAFYVNLSSPLTKPEALPNILRSHMAQIYLLLSKAAKHEPLEI